MWRKNKGGSEDETGSLRPGWGHSLGRVGGGDPHRRNSKRKTQVGMGEERSQAKRKLMGPEQSD